MLLAPLELLMCSYVIPRYAGSRSKLYWFSRKDEDQTRVRIEGPGAMNAKSQ